MDLKEKILEKISLEKLYDDFIEQYQLGNFTEGVCGWNGDDALMGPKLTKENTKNIQKSEKTQKNRKTHKNQKKEH